MQAQTTQAKIYVNIRPEGFSQLKIDEKKTPIWWRPVCLSAWWCKADCQGLTRFLKILKGGTRCNVLGEDIIRIPCEMRGGKHTRRKVKLSAATRPQNKVSLVSLVAFKGLVEVGEEHKTGYDRQSKWRNLNLFLICF